MKKLLLLGVALVLTGCGETATLRPEDGMGVNPKLPKPVKTLVPTVKIAEVAGWTIDQAPTPAPGLQVEAFARNLTHPRWLHVLPNGDVLVAESDAPPKPKEDNSIRGFFMKMLMKKAGSNRGSPNRITLLRDANHDGAAELQVVFLQNLNSPFGMALIGDQLYVANTDSLVRYTYHEGDTAITGPATKVADLPGGPINHHWTKGLIASKDGGKLYVSVGSNSNVAENGMAAESNRAAILEIDAATGATRLFASGLRNPVGMAWNPETGALWTVVNERDEIGSDLVPDYMTSVKPGGFYGWPYSYYGQIVDTRVKPQDPAKVASAIKPDFALGAHTASLGLTFYTGGLLSEGYKNGAFVGQHGSWNRNPPSGYKVIFVPFSGGQPSGMPQDVLTGFLGPDGKARGRPVGVAQDIDGALLVADDAGNTVWRVTPDTQLRVR
ncbi:MULTISPECIES: sorbosone dehydrogenase family protein [Asticcacaulis]|uniref:PQQ-dependent sugar dehydrogenase n=1 Tax=Asticcacaulis TaxID=76890 RepID=UPI001FDA87BD|nr:MULTISPECIES: sorbosone dehydrogenase family protein [Asticcacaulis]MBP2158786.1 glucose/arabinose dehydrogenase [Asticcacaulis solisilvae]MDR6799832.1 glucose/arabinose dehydrogenase [Asticcacaulis sp. BE141]